MTPIPSDIIIATPCFALTCVTSANLVIFPSDFSLFPFLEISLSLNECKLYFFFFCYLLRLSINRNISCTKSVSFFPSRMFILILRPLSEAAFLLWIIWNPPCGLLVQRWLHFLVIEDQFLPLSSPRFPSVLVTQSPARMLMISGVSGLLGGESGNWAMRYWLETSSCGAVYTPFEPLMYLHTEIVITIPCDKNTWSS